MILEQSRYARALIPTLCLRPFVCDHFFFGPVPHCSGYGPDSWTRTLFVSQRCRQVMKMLKMATTEFVPVRLI